jgi:hypothetical protein
MQNNTDSNRKEQEYASISFAQLSKLVMHDLEKASSKTSITVKYTKEQIIRFLDNPKKFQKELRNLSEYLYIVSPNYKRLILYFAGMLRFDYVVEPYDLDIDKSNKEQFKKQYNKVMKSLEIMNIPHEFTKILKHGFKEDIFYGYEYQTDDSYFIQRLDPDLCRIKSIEDGVYNFAFDFSYFKSKEHVEKYPKEFQDKYKLYLIDKSEYKWQELSSDNTICFKVNEEDQHPIPPFSSIFESVFDIDENKRMRRVKTKMDNYMILTQRIPLDEKKGEPNRFLIDIETAMAFHNKASQSLPEEVGLVTSPMPIEAIKMERKNTDSDNVAEAERNYYNAAGVSQLLFNGDKSSNTALNKSIVTDEEIVFMCLKQFERWLNRKLKSFNNNKYKFRVKFLETTRFNIDNVQDRYLKAAQYGLPVKTALAATLGLTPSGLINMTYLENEILDLPNKFIPLSSSHTTSGKDGAGAPEKNEDELSEEGLKTKDTDGNVRD